MATAKVAISLPPELLRWIDLRCRELGVSRSEFIRTAVDQWAQRHREEERDRAYVEGYRRHPETADEVAWSLAAAMQSLADEPWE